MLLSFVWMYSSFVIWPDLSNTKRYIIFENTHSFIWQHQVFHCSLWTLSWGMWDLVPLPRIEPESAALWTWNLSHWTTRKVPKRSIINTGRLIIKLRPKKCVRLKDKLEFSAQVDLFSKPVLFLHSIAFESAHIYLNGRYILIYVF